MYCGYLGECPCFWEIETEVLGVKGYYVWLMVLEESVCACMCMLVCVFRDRIRRKMLMRKLWEKDTWELLHYSGNYMWNYFRIKNEKDLIAEEIS